VKTIDDYMRLIRGLIENGMLNECRNCEKGIGIAFLDEEEIENLVLEDIQSLMQKCLEEFRGCVDLRISRDGNGVISFAVLVTRGNIMLCVPGAIADTPQAALKAALDR